MGSSCSNEELVRHMQRFYSDRSIIEDLDGMRLVCENSAQVAVVEAYAKARKSSPGFQARSYRNNNHAAIPPKVLEEVFLAGGVQIQCPGCEAYFIPVDGRRNFCSQTCRTGGRNGRQAPGRPLTSTRTASKSKKRRPGMRGPGNSKGILPAPSRASA